MNHPWHRHPMRLESDDQKPFECSGCKELGFGPRYQSEKNPRFVLHEVCFKARPTDRPRTHPFTGTDCRFKFLWIPPAGPSRRLCHACQRDVQGFLYRYFVLSKRSWLYFHPCCLNLESTISDPYNRMNLILKDTVPSNFECMECEREEPFIRGWFYLSSCGNYCYHVYCAKKLILDNWERDYFNVPSPSPPSSSSSSSRGRRLQVVVRADTASSSIIRTNEQSDDRSLITAPTSFFALQRRPLWWRPRILSSPTGDEFMRLARIGFRFIISSAIREKLIRLAIMGFFLFIAIKVTPQNPAPLFTALINAYGSLRI